MAVRKIWFVVVFQRSMLVYGLDRISHCCNLLLLAITTCWNTLRQQHEPFSFLRKLSKVTYIILNLTANYIVNLFLSLVQRLKHIPSSQNVGVIACGLDCKNCCFYGIIIIAVCSVVVTNGEYGCSAHQWRVDKQECRIQLQQTYIATYIILFPPPLEHWTSIKRAFS
jgi:hypothetical protein